jgi:hypothetical protein
MRGGVWVLALYILLRGSDSSVLKVLQQAGNLTHAAGGPEAISFCNVFFFSSLICGLLAAQGFSGFFLGPVARS